MISDEQRDYIDRLPELEAIFKRTIAYACRGLRYRAGIEDGEIGAEVAGEAFRRLYSPKYRMWTDSMLTVEGLFEYLKARVKDIVSNHCRDRRHPHSPVPLQHEVAASQVSPEAMSIIQDETEAWLEAAGPDEDLRNLILEHATLNDDVKNQASALGKTPEEIYRLRTQASNLLARVRTESSS